MPVRTGESPESVKEFFMDVLPEGQRGTYEVIAYALGQASFPSLKGVTADDLFRRIQQVLVWPDATVEHLKGHLAKDGNLVRERMELVSKTDLALLGFDASAWN